MNYPTAMVLFLVIYSSRGLIVDVVKGNLMKVGADGSILRLVTHTFGCGRFVGLVCIL